MLYFEYLTGPFKGQGFSVDSQQNITLGRDYSADITINDQTISRKHIEIFWKESEPYIRDLKSRNGSFVNGKKLGEELLRDGDIIQIARSIELKTHFNNSLLIDNTQGDAAESVISYDQNKEQYFNIKEGKSLETLRDLNAFYKIGKILTIEQSSNQLIKSVGQVISDIIISDRTVFLLKSIDSDEIDQIIIPSENSKPHSMPISRTIASRCLENGLSIISEDALIDERFETEASIVTSGIRSVICVPIKSMDKVLGAIYIDSMLQAKAFNDRDLMLLTAIGMQVGVAIARARLFESNQNFLLQTVRTLVATIEIKDTYTKGHSERVTDFSVGIGEELKLSNQDMVDLRIAALLHDIGKIGIPEGILNKPGKLTDAEYDMIKQHPVDGGVILRNLKGKDKIYKAVLHHHERIDGKGYPDGLSGEEIPYFARIICVADAYDAMISTRPYREPLSAKEARTEIRRCIGTQFDQKISMALLDWLNKGKQELSISIIQSIFDFENNESK